MSVSRNSVVEESGNLNITAACFSKICSPLTTTINRHDHLRDLKLSDLNILERTQFNKHIAVLTGADYYYDVLTGEMVRGHGGPIPVNSIFGWVLSGPTKDINTASGIRRGRHVSV